MRQLGFVLLGVHRRVVVLSAVAVFAQRLAAGGAVVPWLDVAGKRGKAL
jgi:hypothetical protein